MSDKIRVAVAGYGNLGRGAEAAVMRRDDMELAAIVSRRPGIATASPDVPVVTYDGIASLAGSVDVCLLCGGSANDLWDQGPRVAALFNTVDSFDTHAKIPEYFEIMDKAASGGGHVSILSAGWDPGVFSLMRLYCGAFLPEGRSETFWGRGVSQGHSDAIRRVPGVLRAVQYTVPLDDAVKAARSGGGELEACQKHRRECFVVPAPGADTAQIENAIKTMPHYFAGYDVTVTFIGEDEFIENHRAMPHGGFVIRNGQTADGSRSSLEFSLNLGSNPFFTSSVMVSCALAAHRLSRAGRTGAATLFDIPPALLSPTPEHKQRSDIL